MSSYWNIENAWSITPLQSRQNKHKTSVNGTFKKSVFSNAYKLCVIRIDITPYPRIELGSFIIYILRLHTENKLSFTT